MNTQDRHDEQSGHQMMDGAFGLGKTSTPWPWMEKEGADQGQAQASPGHGPVASGLQPGRCASG